MTYGPSLSDQFRRAVAYVDKILHGAKPADLPVERPAKFELVLNLKTAKVLGLTIPASVVERADEVIQQSIGGSFSAPLRSALSAGDGLESQ